MIVLDTSAIVAIALAEEEEEAFSRVVAFGAIVGAPTLVETRLVLIDRLGSSERADLFLDAFLDHPSIEVATFGDEQYRAAKLAIDVFGKGRGNKAQLNLGDCMSYATAKSARLPLLFKGRDFVHTDLVAAHQM